MKKGHLMTVSRAVSIRKPSSVVIRVFSAAHSRGQSGPVCCCHVLVSGMAREPEGRSQGRARGAGRGGGVASPPPRPLPLVPPIPSLSVAPQTPAPPPPHTALRPPHPCGSSGGRQAKIILWRKKTKKRQRQHYFILCLFYIHEVVEPRLVARFSLKDGRVLFYTLLLMNSRGDSNRNHSL